MCICHILFAWCRFTHILLYIGGFGTETNLPLSIHQQRVRMDHVPGVIFGGFVRPLIAGHFALPAWLWWAPSVGCYCYECFSDWVRQGQCRLCVDILSLKMGNLKSPIIFHGFPERIIFFSGTSNTFFWEIDSDISWKGILTSCALVARVLEHKQLFRWFRGKFLKWINLDKPSDGNMMIYRNLSREANLKGSIFGTL